MYMFLRGILEKVFILLTLPISVAVILAAAIAIRIADPGPVFFFQIRVGRGSKPFRIYKLRTMFHEWEKDPKLGRIKNGTQLSDDPRLHKLGKFLRKTGIDELPQILNILLGEMSLIGPRPGQIFEVESWMKKYPTLWSHIRHSVNPGILGLAQVSGRSQLSIRHKLMYDVFYASHTSMGLDLVVVRRTPATIRNVDSAY